MRIGANGNYKFGFLHFEAFSRAVSYAVGLGGFRPKTIQIPRQIVHFEPINNRFESGEIRSVIPAFVPSPFFCLHFLLDQICFYPTGRATHTVAWSTAAAPRM